MDVNQTIAHLGAEMAEIREKMVRAERAALAAENHVVEANKHADSVRTLNDELNEKVRDYAETINSQGRQLRYLIERLDDLGEFDVEAYKRAALTYEQQAALAQTENQEALETAREMTEHP